MKSYHRNETLENEIVSLLEKGDNRAISLLYSNYSGALYGIICRMIPTKEIAQEVLQDVFVKVWNNSDKYDSNKGRLFTWLAQIARNTALDKVRSAGYRNNLKTGQLDPLVYDDKSLSETSPIRDSGLHKVIASLDEKYRKLIEYVYFRGFTHSELAEELSLPLGTVKTRVRTAIQNLRKHLGNELIAIIQIVNLVLFG